MNKQDVEAHILIDNIIQKRNPIKYLISKVIDSVLKSKTIDDYGNIKWSIDDYILMYKTDNICTIYTRRLLLCDTFNNYFEKNIDKYGSIEAYYEIFKNYLIMLNIDEFKNCTFKNAFII